MIILRATGLEKSYAGVESAPTNVLRGVNIDVEAGTIISIVGPSGAGKSTLLHILATLDLPDSGRVELADDAGWTNLATLSQHHLAELRSRIFGVVFQFHHLLPEFTTLENVLMPARIAGTPGRIALARAEELLHRVGLHDRRNHMPAQLSGGEQQRVAVARALMNSPKIVLADEPTGNLDSHNAEVVSQMLIELVREAGSSCIIATHSADLAARADVRLQMRDGLLSPC
jgi:lipoprotein-releasing system ATP-binding protein